MLNYRRATIDDCGFVYECISQLLDKEYFNLNRFREFFADALSGALGKMEIWICSTETKHIGCVTANQFVISRYVGYGVEFEEIVILPEFRNRGFGRSFLDFLIEYYKNDNQCRKIIVKTDDVLGAGSLYDKAIGATDMRVYQKYLNKI